jgi:uncharacterized protein YjbJ (UPF0337 family)
MNWDQIEGKWHQLKGKVREQWGKFTDDDLDFIAGKRDQFLGRLQERYGLARAEAERQMKANGGVAENPHHVGERSKGGEKMTSLQQATRITVSLLALVALVGLSACGSTQPVGTQWDDNVITTKVKSKLIADPQVKAFDISVTTNEGIVTLTGRVKEQLQRTEAEKLARDTAGVKGVTNLIKVGELPPPVVRPGTSTCPPIENQQTGTHLTEGR